MQKYKDKLCKTEKKNTLKNHEVLIEIFVALRALQFNLRYSSLNLKLVYPSNEKYCKFVRSMVSCMFFRSPFLHLRKRKEEK